MKIADWPGSSLGYVVGVVAPLIVTLLELSVRPVLDAVPSPLFLTATLVAAWVGGLGPALVATAVGGLLLDYFFVPPIYTLVPDVPDFVGMMAFAMLSVILATLASRTRAVMRELEVERQRERSARAEAERANRAKDQFLAMLGHELRNPLAAIANCVTVLRQTRADPERAEGLRTIIDRQARQLGRLVDDLLDVSRITFEKVELRREPVDLRRAAERTLGTLREAGSLARHDVSLSAERAWVHGDVARLEQVLVNLLDNAVKYTPAGGRIHVSITAREGRAVLRIRDNGIGIAPDKLSSIFEVFIQGSQGIDRPRGLGLGLTLVQRLVELHDGTVEVRSEGPGKGSEFIVCLPQAAPPVAEEREAVEGLVVPDVVRVLIVEDHADTRESLRLLLQAAGYEVHEASDGASGVECVLRVRPDIALIDIGLPTIDGYEVARRVRANPNGQAVRLVALSGYAEEKDRQRSAAAGFDLHLTKPVDGTRLIEIVAAA